MVLYKLLASPFFSFVSCSAILSLYFFSHRSLRLSVGPLSHSPPSFTHIPHIVSVLGLGITEHVREAGAAMQVAEEIGFEGEHFLVDIRLLHPYAISKNRQAAISLLEVALKPIVP